MLSLSSRNPERPRNEPPALSPLPPLCRVFPPHFHEGGQERVVERLLKHYPVRRSVVRRAVEGSGGLGRGVAWRDGVAGRQSGPTLAGEWSWVAMREEQRDDQHFGISPVGTHETTFALPLALQAAQDQGSEENLGVRGLTTPTPTLAT